MRNGTEWIPILVADDSQDDRHLLQRAFQAAGVRNALGEVKDGQELLESLESSLAPGGAGLPGLVLLDMKMPRLDGKEALKRLRADPRFSALPVVLLTTSQYKEDVMDGYRLGANSVISKPFSYDDFIELASMLKKYWLDHVELPILFTRH
jgi:two-component system response regulator